MLDYKRRDPIRFAVINFETFLRKENAVVMPDATRFLQNYLQDGKRLDDIYGSLATGKKNYNDLKMAIRRLSKIALAISTERRHYKGGREIFIDERVVDHALKRIFCSMWPFCK